jgi:4-hydroxy-3-methylbut-2-enyl diphosphate reductase
MHLVENVTDVAALKVGAGGTAQLAYVTQTTLSVDDAATIVTALRERFPDIVGPKKDDICYATQNRQDAVKELACRVGLVIVVGSKNSSNSNRLREVAQNLGVSAYLVDHATQIDPVWLTENVDVGVTAGASAPEILVKEVVERLKALGAASVQTLKGAEESVNFPLPKELI